MHLLSVHGLCDNLVVALWPSENAALKSTAKEVHVRVSSVALTAWTRSEGHAAAARTLLQAGSPAAIVAAGLQGYVAPWPSWRDALVLLQSSGYDIFMQGAVLSCALEAQNARAVGWLLAAKANPEIRVEADLTPLRWAARSGDTSMVQVLLNANAFVNTRGAYGYTALMTAAMHGQAEVVDILLAAGAEVNTNGDGETAIDLAHRFPKIEGVLESHVREHGWAHLKSLSLQGQLTTFSA